MALLKYPGSTWVDLESVSLVHLMGEHFIENSETTLTSRNLAARGNQLSPKSKQHCTTHSQL